MQVDDWTGTDPTDAACIAQANLGRLADLGAAVAAWQRWAARNTETLLGDTSRPMRVPGGAGRNYH